MHRIQQIISAVPELGSSHFSDASQNSFLRVKLLTRTLASGVDQEGQPPLAAPACDLDDRKHRS